jgi:predicted dehydrogenase
VRPRSYASSRKTDRSQSQRRLKGVLVGCGAIAREHLAALSELGYVEVAAVCDLSAARAEATAERFGIARHYLNHNQMIAEVRPDLVHITTPPSSHFSIAKDCLSSGRNVLCEKPITMEYQDFRQLHELAVRNNCLLLENHNMRFHSSILKIRELMQSGRLGDVLDVQVLFCLNIMGPRSPYIDRNAPHFGLVLRGGVIGDFLTHIAYLALMFTGAVVDVRTVWTKHVTESPLPADEFRALIKGERASAYVGFSGNGQPNGFWVRLAGTLMQVETNLLEPPRLTLRRARAGEQAVATFVDGIAESCDVFTGVVAGFWRKLGGGSRYDGLSELIASTYRALDTGVPPPISLDEIDEVARLVDAFTNAALKL